MQMPQAGYELLQEVLILTEDLEQHNSCCPVIKQRFIKARGEVNLKEQKRIM